MNYLQCLIGGHERGGTTLFLEILRNHPLIDGRFECGVYLWENPNLFKDSELHWDVFLRGWFEGDSFDAERICATESHCEMVNRLHTFMGFPDEVRMVFKSPAYMMNLTNVLSRCNKPCVIVVRDPRGLYWSRKKKHEIGFGKDGIIEFCDRYNNYCAALSLGLEKYENRVLVVQYEAFCEDPVYWGSRLFEFVGLDFRKEYVQELPNYLNYSVHGDRIDNGFCEEWKGNLLSEESDLILMHTSQNRQYFYYQ